MGIKMTLNKLLQIYLDSFELERHFLAAHAKMETGLYDNGDEVQTMGVSEIGTAIKITAIIVPIIFIVIC